MSWELSAWNISLCLYTILQHHWANNLLMLYQPEEALFIFFTARTDPCQVRAIARYDIKSETPCFLLAVVSFSKSEKILTENTTKHWLKKYINETWFLAIFLQAWWSQSQTHPQHTQNLKVKKKALCYSTSSSCFDRFHQLFLPESHAYFSCELGFML